MPRPRPRGGPPRCIAAASSCRRAILWTVVLLGSRARRGSGPGQVVLHVHGCLIATVLGCCERILRSNLALECPGGSLPGLLELAAQWAGERQSQPYATTCLLQVVCIEAPGFGSFCACLQRGCLGVHSLAPLLGPAWLECCAILGLVPHRAIGLALPPRQSAALPALAAPRRPRPRVGIASLPTVPRVGRRLWGCPLRATLPKGGGAPRALRAGLPAHL